MRARWWERECMDACDFYASTEPLDCADHHNLFWPRRAAYTCYVHAQCCTTMLYYAYYAWTESCKFHIAAGVASSLFVLA